MKLGLGLGLSAAQRQSNYDAVTADWMGWDGSSDGAITRLFSSGGTGGQDVVAISDAEAVLFWNTGAGEGKAVVLDVDNDLTFKSETTNTALTLSISDPDGINIITLTDALLVALAEDNVSGLMECSLISKSGKVLAELGNANTGVSAGANFRNSLARLNNTQAVFVGRENNDSNHGRVGVVDASGGVLSVGALLDLNDGVGRFLGICRLTDNSFFVVTRQKVHYCTVSGTTVTHVSSLDIDAAGTLYDDTMIGRVDDVTALTAYEDGAISQVHVNSFTWNGSAIVRGTAQADIFDGNKIFQGTGTVTAIGNRQVMFSGRQDDETPQFSAAVVCAVDEAGVITVGGRVQTSADVTAANAVIDVSPSGLYVFSAYLDGTTTPVQQIGTRILKGF